LSRSHLNGLVENSAMTDGPYSKNRFGVGREGGKKGMSVGRETDFLDLYRDLELHPDCGLPEFRQAYRRRLSILHPDRPIDGQSSSPEQLQRLTALYGAAMAFHRQHGRLPGAMQSRPFQPNPVLPPVAAPVADAPGGHARRWLLLPVAALAAWMLWPADQPSAPADNEPATEAINNAATYAEADAALKLGMDQDTVRAIEGEPVIVGDDHWDYGPSWVRFEDHKLAGWYSSPMHPLKIAGQPARR
jgi:hypothetical protein